MNAFFPACSTGSRSAANSNSSRSSLYSVIMESLWSTISSLVVVGEGSSSSSASSEVLVKLPYIGPTPLPIVLFVGSALMFRVSQFWRQSTSRPNSSSSSSSTSSVSSSTSKTSRPPCNTKKAAATAAAEKTRIVAVAKADCKAKTYNVSEYTNQNQQALNRFMEKARMCRQQLRHVDDPERARRNKICFIRKQHRAAANAGDPLQLSESKLLDKLANLKKTTRTNSSITTMTGKDTQNVHVGTKNNFKC